MMEMQNVPVFFSVGSPVEGQHCAKMRALTFVMFPTF